MKRLSFILLLCAIVSVASAQKITHTFQDVALSDALKYIQEQTANYDITFIYDELEDFRVTTHLQNKPIPDAIVQLAGFYPVRVVKSGKHEIYVECTHKTDRQLCLVVAYLMRVAISLSLTNKKKHLFVSHTLATRPFIGFAIKITLEPSECIPIVIS